MNRSIIQVKQRRRKSMGTVLSAFLSFTCFLCSQSSLQSRAQAVEAPPPLLLGAAWYPEQWPESRWDADLTLMQKAHMHLVRLGEFSWSRLEPQEGKYDLDWMERAVNLAGQHGIYVIIGTPTAGPPV